MFLLDKINLSVPVITRLEPMVCGLNTWKGSLQKLLKNIQYRLSIVEVYIYIDIWAIHMLFIQVRNLQWNFVLWKTTSSTTGDHISCQGKLHWWSYQNVKLWIQQQWLAFLQWLQKIAAGTNTPRLWTWLLGSWVVIMKYNHVIYVYYWMVKLHLYVSCHLKTWRYGY